MKQVRIRTYRQVWLQETMIYQIERIRLPFPISTRQAGIFALAAVAMVLLSSVPGVALIPGLVRYLLIPGAVAWGMTKLRLDGKPPLRWLVTWVRYAAEPKRLVRFAPLKSPGKVRARGRVRGPSKWRLRRLAKKGKAVRN